MDMIEIEGLRVFAHHGATEEERRKGQIFSLDIRLERDLSRPCQTDDLADTVNYSTVCKRAAAVMTAEDNALIERAAERVAEALLAAFPIDAVGITLHKPNAPIAADFADVAVTIRREKHKIQKL